VKTKGYSNGAGTLFVYYLKSVNVCVNVRKRASRVIFICYSRFERRGSWLHDCGKIGVPESLLNLARRLDESEMETIRRHPLWGAEVARQAGLSAEVVNIILYHHEKFDGSGYPSCLKQGKIPLEARIQQHEAVHGGVNDAYDPFRTFLQSSFRPFAIFYLFLQIFI
jgi:hypothetical protein